MHCLKTMERLNRYAVEGRPPQSPYRHHPRIQQLRQDINGLPVDCYYKAALHRTLGRYADYFIERPHYQPGEGWDDLEALQQSTLADVMAEARERLFRR